ncbi:ABC transporter permease [Candidatus Aerophobetes bacterium]|nr:ABC transporter permease [Candidatus Aerophobetes bacterium]
MLFKLLRGKHRTVVTIYLILAVLFIIPSLVSPVFRSYENISNILNQTASLGIVSMGQTFIVLLSGLDLSVGSVISLTTVLCATSMGNDPLTIFLAVLLCLGVGAGIGSLNGILVSKVKLSPLIATLGMMALIQGVALQIRPYPGGYVPRSFAETVTGNLYHVPVPAILLVLVLIGTIIILRKTVLGNYIYATGGNEENARLAGVNIDKVKIFSYTICGLIAAVAGLVLTGRIRSGDPLVGTAFPLDSITAVIVGGTPFAGGQGGVEGTLAGALIIAMLSNMLNLLNVSSFYQYIVKGLILITAVVIYSLREK